MIPVRALSPEGADVEVEDPTRITGELPCGCRLCVCDDPVRCHGCGARYCPAHNAFNPPPEWKPAPAHASPGPIRIEDTKPSERDYSRWREFCGLMAQALTVRAASFEIEAVAARFSDRVDHRAEDEKDASGRAAHFRETAETWRRIARGEALTDGQGGGSGRPPSRACEGGRDHRGGGGNGLTAVPARKRSKP
jgi:hypothetical protein